ncbi:hypothetical protein IAT40_004308 [Kwoniella sp. CBS 6097]
MNYRDQNADLTLVSREGIGFKVYSYMLKANSTVFREMMSDSNIKDSHIPFDAAEHDLTYFLDLIHKIKIPQPDNCQQVTRILSLCDMFDCPFLAERILNRLDHFASIEPWAVFCLASRHENLALAKAALRFMWKDKVHALYNLGNITSNAAGQPSLPYLIGYLQAKTTLTKVQDLWYTPAYNHGNNDTLHSAWENLSKNFQPRS